MEVDRHVLVLAQAQCWAYDAQCSHDSELQGERLASIGGNAVLCCAVLRRLDTWIMATAIVNSGNLSNEQGPPQVK